MPAPFRRICPLVGSSKPATIRSVVVFPQPDGPSSEKNSPRPMSSETLFTARCVEYSFETSSSSRTCSIFKLKYYSTLSVHASFFRGCGSEPGPLRADRRQMAGRPRVETACDVQHLLETGAFQQARGDRAAVAAFAVHRYGPAAIQVAQQRAEMIQWLVPRTPHVAALPLRRAPYVQYLDRIH